MEQTVDTTSNPAGFVPAAIRYEDKTLCVGACDVTPITRRPMASRSNYCSGVVQDDPLPGTMLGRDFVTGVGAPSSSGVSRVSF